MKKLFTLLIVMVASVGTMFANNYLYPVKIGDLDYYLNDDDYTARVTYNNSDGLSYNIGWNITTAIIPSSVTYDNKIFAVKEIGYHAFSDCSSLTSVIIPNSVTNIERYAFSSCSSLTSVIIPNSVTNIESYAFSGCSNLTSVVIGDNVNNIGEEAFSICRSLTSATIPNSVAFIGDGAFSGCSSLASAIIPNSVTYLGNGAFRLCSNLASVTIPNSVTYLGDGAFNGCSNLTSVTISNSVTSIGKYTFYECTSLTSVIIPSSVTSIESFAFGACSSLTSVVIHDGLANIGERAFCNCGSLISITIPNSVTNLGYGAFIDCSNLTSVSIPNSVTNIEGYAFGSCSSLASITIPNSVIYLGDGAFHGCSSLVSANIGNSVTSIGDNVFWGCSNLTSVTIPNSVTGIGWGAFSYCSSLTSVSIGNSVTSIGEGAFKFCSSLTSVTIPNSVTNIGENAFLSCFMLTSVVFESEYPATLGTGAFINTNNCPLVVPCSAVDAYKTAWPDYADRITCSGSGSQGITVRLDPQSCADWSVVRLWAWTSEGNLFDAWPGIVVSQDADGWYSYTFDESVESVNIIWTDGTNQTVNIEGVTASTCYALNSTSGKTITASVVDCGSTASNYYTIRFLNWDGTVLQSSQVKEGELPSYTGTTPVRPADEQYTYSFSGWSPAIATATADADYTAQFTATEKTTDPSIPTVQDLATAGYDVANKVVLCLYFDDAPCYDVVIAGTYMADEAGSWITDPEQLVHMAALESFEGWYAAEIPYSSNAQGKPIQLKSNGAFSWEYQSGDADAWIKRGGEGSQTAAIVAGYNNEADVYYPAPGCYIYELAYWKNHNNPCVIIPSHNYTIHLYAPDACEEMKPAIIGNFNNWNTGVPMSETTDEQGKKMYTITIASDEGLMFKFRDAAYDSWSNELQEYLSDVKVWSTFSNFMIPAATQDTTVIFDFSDNSRYRFRLCEKTEDVVVWLKVPTGAPGYYNGAIEMVVYSADEPTAMPLQYNQEDELWSVELQAKGSNYFFVREANSDDNYILNYTHYYYSDGSDEYVWSTWSTTFQYYWEDGTGDFTGSKIIMLDISNPSYYKWAVPAIGTGIEDVLSDQVQCTKVLRDGQIFILRGDKTYTLQGQEVK